MAFKTHTEPDKGVDMEFVAIDAQAEVKGQSVLSVIHGMGDFEPTARDILAHNGIRDPRPDAWYPQQRWLDAFREIADTIGGRSLQAIGKAMVEHGDLSAEAEGIADGLRRLDIGYHESHRLAGRVLYDPWTGELSEGIGHYQVADVGERSVRLLVDSPLPCAFDMGLIRAIAHGCQPADARSIAVEHGLTCRSDGAPACLYVVSW